MKSAHDHPARRRFPILQGVLPITTAQIPAEILAGITLAAIAVPEVMGYTKIAGTPVITGLYTMLIPTTLFALFGSSRHLVVGADSATAAILASALVGIAATGSEQYMALAGVLALMAAGFLILARLMRLGFLADFLSRTVLIGFLTGVGVQVALGEIAGMLGLKGGGHGALGKFWNDLQQLGQVNRYELMVALSVLVVIVGFKKVSKKIPGALIAAIGAVVITWALGLDKQVHIVGAVPSGLPHLGLPKVNWSWTVMTTLLPSAFAMFVVILAQSAATSRAFATRYDEDFSENTDLVGLALGQYWRWPVRHLRRQRQPDEDANRRRRRRPQPTVASGDGGDGRTDPALFDRRADLFARSGFVGHRVSDWCRLDRCCWDAEGFRSKAIGVLVGTDHRVDGRDRRCRTGDTARHCVVAHRSHPVRVSTEERSASAELHRVAGNLCLWPRRLRQHPDWSSTDSPTACTTRIAGSSRMRSHSSRTPYSLRCAGSASMRPRWTMSTIPRRRPSGRYTPN